MEQQFQKSLSEIKIEWQIPQLSAAMRCPELLKGMSTDKLRLLPSKAIAKRLLVNERNPISSSV